jgi:hypothetical protein
MVPFLFLRFLSFFFFYGGIRRASDALIPQLLHDRKEKKGKKHRGIDQTSELSYRDVNEPKGQTTHIHSLSQRKERERDGKDTQTHTEREREIGRERKRERELTESPKVRQLSLSLSITLSLFF